MPTEHLAARIEALVAEIGRRPANLRALQDELRDKLAEAGALGLSLPIGVAALEAALEAAGDSGEAGGDDFFDNMPV